MISPDEIRGETTEPDLARIWGGMIERGLAEYVPGDPGVVIVKPPADDLEEWSFEV